MPLVFELDAQLAHSHRACGEIHDQGLIRLPALIFFSKDTMWLLCDQLSSTEDTGSGTRRLYVGSKLCPPWLVGYVERRTVVLLKRPATLPDLGDRRKVFSKGA